MTDDLLKRATQALRETTDGVQLRSGLTRARILDAAAKRQVGARGLVLRWFIALAAVLAASTALARVAQYWPEIQRALAPDVSEPSRRSVPTRPRRVQAPAPQPKAAVTEPAAEPAAAPIPEPATSASDSPAPVVRRSRQRPQAPRPRAAAPVLPEPVVSSAAVPVPAPESAELAVFRRAQRLHLAHDARAIAAWDDYLRVAGNGVLVPEARYNRALCLVRLGRTVEARAALEPFARGEYGSYRRGEAASLLEALPH